MTLKQALIQQGMKENEVDSSIKEAIQLMQEYMQNGDLTSAYDICNEMWSLEPDYLIDLL